ncbi:Uncharacterized protein MJ0678 [Durusdinium trenchii]|uniref:Uncharacterized protein MJ0678 n=1 Tax=Durusdinium trenchii TaxID=1381693 RepID=A0ABP0JNL9_9DINO
MALRVIQIYVPEETDTRVAELLEDREILGRWRDTDAGQVVVHLLVPAEETEPIMDRFEAEYRDSPGFHVILFPVEAVLPRPMPPEEGEPANESEADSLGEDCDSQERISREELYTKITDELGVTRVFLGMTLLSAVVAAVGLIRNDVAVIIGAMVIAPLLGPNVAMSLATTLGDFTLLRRALVTNVVGITTAFTIAFLIGLLFTVDPEVPAIENRSQVTYADILLALAAGSAGTLAFTRGLSNAVIGVMVAVALMPPLVACGMLFGDALFHRAGQAALLTIANVICVNLAGVATFYAQGVRPRTWLEAKQAGAAIRNGVIIWIVLLALLASVLQLSG